MPNCSAISLLRLPCVLVARSSVGAIGRVLAALAPLSTFVRAVVLLGERDLYAEEEIQKHGQVAVFSFVLPSERTRAGFALQAMLNRAVLTSLRLCLQQKPEQTQDLVARDRVALWHPYTALRESAEPLVVVSAENEFLYLEDKRCLIDGISSWWTILHGHRPPALLEALHRVGQQIDHVHFAGVTHEPGILCAEALLKRSPWPTGKVFFSDNGSTAVEVALKMAYQWWCQRGEPQRTLFIGFENGYHGDTFGAMAVGRDPLFFGTFEPLLFQVLQVPVSLTALEKALRENAARVAAVIIEPLVQGAGGMVMHSAETLRELAELCHKYGVHFIADEVMTANRTGTFWAHSQASVVPDLICAAKTLTGGLLPLAATLASPKIVEGFDNAVRTKTFFHGHSFTANPLACGIAVANLRLLEGEEAQHNLQRICDFWQQAFTGAEYFFACAISSRASSMTYAGGVTPFFFAQASFWACVLQQQSRQQVSALPQPHGLSWQGNGFDRSLGGVR